MLPYLLCSHYDKWIKYWKEIYEFVYGKSSDSKRKCGKKEFWNSVRGESLNKNKIFKTQLCVSVSIWHWKQQVNRLPQNLE